MSQKVTVEALKCPKCQNLVLPDKYDEHVKSDHKEHIFTPPVTVTGRAKTGSFTKQILFMVQDYPLGFAVWSIIVMGITVALMIGRI